nr:class I SAM-dependent methyltransferase [Candidatus Sigynarchaeota archaeon]
MRHRSAPPPTYYEIQSQTDLPFLPTPETIIKEVFVVLEADFGLVRKSRQRFIDLGSGTGDVVVCCASNYKIRADGIEINEKFVNEARMKIKKAGIKHTRMWKGDLFDFSLARYDFIFLFSLPHNQRFLNHVFQTAKTGAIVISYKYPLDELNQVLGLKKELHVSLNGMAQEVYFYTKI